MIFKFYNALVGFFLNCNNFCSNIVCSMKLFSKCMHPENEI